MSDAADPRPAEDWSHPHDRPFRRFVVGNRAPLGSFAVFVLMMAIFLIANPAVFTSWTLYSSVLTTLPVAIFLTVPLVFVVTAGEIDLSFPSTMGFAAWAFALVVQAGHDPFLGILAAIATGLVLGLFVGVLVVYANLSSLIATLGMNFVLRGIILIATEGKSIALVTLGQTWAYKLFSSVVWGIPVQILWAIAFVVFSVFLYRRHRFGVQVHAVGDNPDSAQQMGINVKRVRVLTFVFVGLRRRLRRRLLDDDQLHLVADLGRRLPAAGARLGLRRRHPDLGRHRDGLRRRDRRADGVLHPDRHRRGGAQRLLRPVLQRPDHNSLAAWTPLEPVSVQVTRSCSNRTSPGPCMTVASIVQSPVLWCQARRSIRRGNSPRVSSGSTPSSRRPRRIRPLE